MWSSAFETTYNVYFRMNELRLYDNVLSTPVEVQDLVAGDLAWSATRATVYGIVVLAVIAIFGLVSSWWALLIPPFVLLGALCFSVIGYTFTTLIPKIDLYSYFFTLFITPMFLFSGLFFPFNQLPDWVHVVAWFMPLYHLVEITRGLATGPEFWSVVGNAAWLAVLSALLFTIPVRALRKKLSPEPCTAAAIAGTMPRRESAGRTLHRADGGCRSAGDPGLPGERGHRSANPRPERARRDPALLDKVNAIGSLPGRFPATR